MQLNSDISTAGSAQREKKSSAPKETGSLLTSFGSKMVSAGMDQLVGILTNSITSIIDSYVNRIQYAQEALDDFHSLTMESQNKLEIQRNWISENGFNYARLAEGVDNNGYNVSLSTEEFAEYQALTKEIADMFPAMISGYNEQNNAIVKMKGNIDALTESYKKNANESYAQTLSNASEGFDNYKTVIKDNDAKRAALNHFISTDDIFAHRNQNRYQFNPDDISIPLVLDSLDRDTRDKLHEELNGFLAQNPGGTNGKAFKFTDLSMDLQQKIKAAFALAKSTINAETQKIKPILSAYIFSNNGDDSGYSSLDESGQQIIRNIIENLDDNFYKQFDTDTEMVSHFYTYYMEPLQDGLDKTDLAVRINTLFSLNEKDYKSYQEYIDAVNKVIDQLKGYKDKDGNPLFSDEQLDGLRNVMGTGSTDSNSGKQLIEKVIENYKSIEGAEDFIKSLNKDELRIIKHKSNSIKTLDDLKRTVSNYNTAQSKKEESSSPLSFSSSWNSLGRTGITEIDGINAQEKKKLLELARSGKLTTEEFNKSSLSAQIMKDTGLSAESATMKINRQVDDTGRLTAMQTGIRAITSAYQEKGSTKNNTVSPSTLNTMHNTLGISEWDADDQQVWEEYKKTAGDSSKTTEELREAQNKLAESYMNSNNFLAGLDKSNQDYYKSLLKDIGIMNAEAIVAEQLAENLRQAKEAKLESALVPIDISDATDEEIVNFRKEAKELGFSNEELTEFLIQKQKASETGLNDLESIDSLIKFCHRLGITNKELEKLIRLKRKAASPETRDSQGNSLNTTTGSQWTQTLTKKNITDDIANQKKKKKTKKGEKEIEKPEIGEDEKENPLNNNPPTVKAPKAKQEIDWISRRLAVLQSRIDLTKTRFENLFSLKTKKNNLNTQISQITKLLKAQEKSAAKYEKKANGIKISKNKKTNKSLKEKVKEGAINGKNSSLIHSYHDGTAKKITSYQNYIDKVKEARKATEELRSSLKDLNKQKLDLALDHNETKRSYSEAKYPNAVSASAKNKLLDDEISIYQSDDKAYNTYYKKAKRFRTSSGSTALSALKKSGLKKGTKKKIKNLIKKGKEIPDTLLNAVKKKNSSLYNKLIDYNNNVDYVSDVLNEKNTAKEEAKASIREKRMQKIENIQKHYENRIGKLNDEEQGIQNKADLMEARGQTISADYYQNQNKYEQNKRQEALNEKNAVQKSLDEAMAKGDIKIYSDEWYEIQSTLQTLDNTINDCDVAIANNSSAIRELHTTMLDKMAEDAARSNTEADFMATLLSHQELTDSKTGDLTDSGLATLGTYGINYSTSKAQRENFNQERRILDKMKESGTLRWGDGSHDYDSLEQLEEAYKNIIDRQQEWAKSEFDAEQKIIDLMKSKYQAQLDYMNRIIDARKNVLNMEKDLYDYQRNIADKTKNISTLEKQLSALQGDDSEEGRARRSKLQTSLDEANMDLQDTEYDKYISDQQNMLDNMSSQYEDLLSSLFRDTDALLQDGLTQIQTNGGYIQGILNKKAEDYGYSYSETFGKIVECLTEIGTPSANPPSGNSGAEQNYNARQNASHSSQPADSPLFPSMQQQMNNAEQSVRNAEVTQLKSFLAVHSGKADTSKPLRPAKSNETFSSELNQKLSKYGYVVKSGSGSGGLKYINMFAQILGDLSGDGSYQANGKVYKALSKKYPHVGFRTGGIIRASGVPSDGDRIAIRVNPNETILTQDFTKLLPDAVNMMQQFTRPVSIPGYLQNMKSLAPGGSTSIGSVNLSLDLPNVENSKDFITELQNNRKIQRALEISISDCIRNGRITSNIQSVL